VFSYILVDVKTHEFATLFRFETIIKLDLKGSIDPLKPPNLQPTTARDVTDVVL